MGGAVELRLEKIVSVIRRRSVGGRGLGSVLESSEEGGCCGLTDESQGFSDVYFPGSRGPAEPMFDYVIWKVGMTEDETCCDTERVGSDVFQTCAVEVGGSWICSHRRIAKELCDCGVVKEDWR